MKIGEKETSGMEQAQFSLQVHASRAVNPVILSLLMRQERETIHVANRKSFRRGGEKFLTGARFLCC